MFRTEHRHARRSFAARSSPASRWLLALARCAPRRRPPYSGIVVFGTSLSDSGNAFALHGDANTPPDYLVDALLVPSAPYAKGGHHFSNGATWVEQFARSLGLAGSVQPAFRSASPRATNFAVGAARAWADGQNVNLSDQVDSVPAVHGRDGIARCAVCHRDGRQRRARRAGRRSRPITSASSSRRSASIGSNVVRLYGAGARRFLVWNAPNPALTPALRRLASVNPNIAPLATFLTQSFNGNLGGLLTDLSELPGATIDRLDADSLLNGHRRRR